LYITLSILLVDKCTNALEFVSLYIMLKTFKYYKYIIIIYYT